LCLLLILIFIFTAACGLNSNLPFQAEVGSGVSPLATPAGLHSFAPGLVSAGDGLADLQSYRANWIVEFEGTRNGQPASGRLESLKEVTRQPAALHQYLRVDTSVSNPELVAGTAEFYRVADKVYIKKEAGGEWFTFSDSAISPDTLGFFALDRLIVLPATTSQPSQPEMLDDLRVQRFSFTERDLQEPNIIFEKAEGNLWLAPSGDYLMQYAISATLRIVIPDPKAHFFDQGRLNLRYTLTDINAAFDLIPPQDVLTKSNPLSSLPRLPDAEIVSVFPTFIEYTSAITPVNAALFYRDELTNQGWTEDDFIAFNEKARLSYAKDGAALTILINPAADPQKIKVLLDLRQQP
jgi:hypothetical protein